MLFLNVIQLLWIFNVKYLKAIVIKVFLSIFNGC